jgi:hypothetical protein
LASHMTQKNIQFFCFLFSNNLHNFQVKILNNFSLTPPLTQNVQSHLSGDPDFMVAVIKSPSFSHLVCLNIDILAR